MTRIAFLDFDRTLSQEDSFLWILRDDPTRKQEIQSIVASKTSNENDNDYNHRFLRKMRVLQGLSYQTLQDQCQRTPIPLVPDARTFIQHLQSIGFCVVVLSGGIEEVVEASQKELGFDAFFATSCLKNHEGTHLTGEAVGGCMTREGKGKVVRQICKMMGCSPLDCVAVGDGVNDISMFREVGFSVAFGSDCAEKVLEVADKWVLTGKLMEVFDKIKGWIREQPREWVKSEIYDYNTF